MKLSVGQIIAFGYALVGLTFVAVGGTVYRDVVLVRESEEWVALKQLESHPHTRLILSDLIMPEMDGLEFLQAVKANPAFATIPFIMCTSLADAAHVGQAAAAGCKHCLVKPIKRPDLLSRVAEVFSSEETAMDEAGEIAKRFGIGEQELQAIAEDFRDVLAAKAEVLESMTGQNEVDESSLGLGVIHESATIFGAKRLVELLPPTTAVLGSSKPNRPTLNRPLTLKEMRTLMRVLSSVPESGVG